MNMPMIPSPSCILSRPSFPSNPTKHVTYIQPCRYICFETPRGQGGQKTVVKNGVESLWSIANHHMHQLSPLYRYNARISSTVGRLHCSQCIGSIFPRLSPLTCQPVVRTPGSNHADALSRTQLLQQKMDNGSSVGTRAVVLRLMRYRYLGTNVLPSSMRPSRKFYWCIE